MMSKDAFLYIFVYPVFALALALGLPALFGGTMYLSTLTAPAALLILGIYKVTTKKE
ncbi:hypothetical protein [Alkalicoccus chagannorensis]|uniref:hypothetical protein n=1 Tax=Alkalicoccus chagannorensis TaxID=427072 RepID=UPI0004217AFE|nr:hypothetical protein [Alkalicoccus chagannorensis]